MATIPASSLVRLRRWECEDQMACEQVCIATGDCGADASGLYRRPELLPALYFTPYVCFDRSLAWVVDRHTADDGAGGAAGYLVATADSTTFDHWCRLAWWPVLQNRYPIDSLGQLTDKDRQLLAELHRPARSGHWLWREFPAHLHIDLLPSVQGMGMGRHLIETALAALARRGVRGVHVGVDAGNTNAMEFYRHVGFQAAPPPPSDVEDSGVFYVRRLG